MSISLNDLLDLYPAPKYIDFISIDTEGSEFEIVKNFNFTRHEVGMLAIEHNFTKTRTLVYKLMERNGYERKYSEISGIDDWFFPENVVESKLAPKFITFFKWLDLQSFLKVKVLP